MPPPCCDAPAEGVTAHLLFFCVAGRLLIFCVALPPSFFFFLNPCCIGQPENTCTQGGCALRRFRGSGVGWCWRGAAPVRGGPGGRVLAGVFGPGCPEHGVDSACFERPFSGSFWSSFSEFCARALHDWKLWGTGVDVGARALPGKRTPVPEPPPSPCNTGTPPLQAVPPAPPVT